MKGCGRWYTLRWVDASALRVVHSRIAIHSGFADARQEIDALSESTSFCTPTPYTSHAKRLF